MGGAGANAAGTEMNHWKVKSQVINMIVVHNVTTGSVNNIVNG